MHHRSRVWGALLLATGISAFATPPALGADWPTWRHDARRSAASPEALPGKLHLRWVRAQPPLKVAWPDEPRMRFDAGYEPVVMGKTLFVGSSRNDRVTALDTETGAERWRFYADGPVRLAPLAWRDKVYVVSDDGHLYCLDAKTGDVRWKHRGGPTDRKLLGNERLISAWPARGAPVLVDGTIYYAASVWPFMGIFIYAVDAETGEVVWRNEGLGARYMLQPHNSPAFAGIAPQGYFVATGDKLLVAGGRSVPACLDRATGELLYYRLAKNGHYGSAHVSATGKYFANAGVMFELDDGGDLGAVPPEPVMTAEVVYAGQGSQIQALDLAHPKVSKSSRDRRKTPVLPTLWALETEKGVKVYLKAGERLYAGVKRSVMAVDLPSSGGKPRISWRAKIDGTPWTMLAADGKLFVVTLEGGIYCYSAEPVVKPTRPVGKPTRHETACAAKPPPDRWTQQAEDILKRTGVHEGYCVAFGVGTGRLVEALARRSKLHVIAVDPDAKKVAAARQRLDAAGLYGHRVAAFAADPASTTLPPYLASLIVSEDLEGVGLAKTRGFVEQVFQTLRPYGGVACLPVPADRREAFAGAVAEAKLAGAVVKQEGDLTCLTRPGPLPGAADWTHQYADASNTCVGADARVKLPLGMLWFGGPSNVKILPRHGHGPTEHVVGGRLFIEGPDILRALDVYTGRLLWEATLPGIGLAYNNTGHQPGANAIGSNYASASDGIYVAHGVACLRLDPATGKTLSTFKLPAEPDGKRPLWGNLRIWEDLLVAAVSPVIFMGAKPPGRPGNWDHTASKRLTVLDRHSGKVHWSVDAAYSFRHNAICVGAGKVFCLDRHPDGAIRAMKNRGITPTEKAKLLAFDVRTGKPCWQTERDVFGTWLSYSAKHDVLVQTRRGSRDMLTDELANQRIVAYRGKDGERLWAPTLSNGGPVMLHGETIITQGSVQQGAALELLTGKKKNLINPLTGAQTEFRFKRNYGCNTAIASQHLILFRSAAAGYFDLDGLSGTGNLGGFKSGCTSNLIAANGVLSAPDYTYTCTCSYQNQCSLALVPMPEVEVWTFNPLRVGSDPILRLGVNLGAPGDRMADDGTLWLEEPQVGGPSAKVDITLVPDEPALFRRHSLQIGGEGHAWVAASGATGLEAMTVKLAEDASKPRTYTVKLVFCEPGEAKPGERVFAVAVQGKPVVSSLDVVKEAKGPWRGLVRRFGGVQVKDKLTIALTPAEGSKRPPVLCGVEVVAEKG